MLLDELRRQRILLPTPRVLELVVHHSLTRAERVTHQALIQGMPSEQMVALDGLLATSANSGIAPIAWMRQAPASPAARNLLGLIERMEAVRAVGLDRDRESAVPAAAFDALANEGLRMTAQHLRDLAQPRRVATVAAAAIRLETDLGDAALFMFDKLMGGLSRRAERSATDNAAVALRDAQIHLRLLARAGRAVIAAHEGDTDLVTAVDEAIGWSRFLRAVVEAEALARPEVVDMRAELIRRWPIMRRFAPPLLEAFVFDGAPSASNLLKAMALLRESNRTGKRKLSGDIPTGFIRRGWRPFRAWEVCVLSELRDRTPCGRHLGPAQSAIPQLRGMSSAAPDFRGAARRGTTAHRSSRGYLQLSRPHARKHSRPPSLKSPLWLALASCRTRH